MKTFISFHCKFALVLFFGLSTFYAQAQDPSAILDLESTSQGLLTPRMTTSDRTGISNPAQGLMVYDTDTKSFWYYKDTAWSELGAGTSPWFPAVNGIWYPIGTVGIGTVIPAAKLDVAGQIKATTPAGETGLNLSQSDSYADLRVIRNTLSSFDNDLYFNFDAPTGGKLRFYTDSSERMTLSGSTLDVFGQIKTNTPAGETGLNLSQSDSYADLRNIRNTLSTVDNNLYFNFLAGSGSEMHFYSNNALTMSVKDNQLLVGTTTGAAGFKMSVDGKIACEEVLVDLDGDWPDYVFKQDYELKSLIEVKQHIEEKGHLPGVPSAQEVADNGIVIGEMNKILIEKIEELTLYILQQEEKIKAQDARLKALENK